MRIDRAAVVARRELKGFQRGKSRRISFELSAQDFAFYDRDMRPIVESVRP